MGKHLFEVLLRLWYAEELAGKTFQAEGKVFKLLGEARRLECTGRVYSQESIWWS